MYYTAYILYLYIDQVHCLPPLPRKKSVSEEFCHLLDGEVKSVGKCKSDEVLQISQEKQIFHKY